MREVQREREGIGGRKGDRHDRHEEAGAIHIRRKLGRRRNGKYRKNKNLRKSEKFRKPGKIRGRPEGILRLKDGPDLARGQEIVLLPPERGGAAPKGGGRVQVVHGAEAAGHNLEGEHQDPEGGPVHPAGGGGVQRGEADGEAAAGEELGVQLRVGNSADAQAGGAEEDPGRADPGEHAAAPEGADRLGGQLEPHLHRFHHWGPRQDKQTGELHRRQTAEDGKVQQDCRRENRGQPRKEVLQICKRAPLPAQQDVQDSLRRFQRPYKKNIRRNTEPQLCGR